LGEVTVVDAEGEVAVLGLLAAAVAVQCLEGFVTPAKGSYRDCSKCRCQVW